MDGHTNSVISLLLVNRLMYTGSADGTAKCWVTEFGDCSRVYKGHKGSVISMKFKNGFRKLSACTAYIQERVVPPFKKRNIFTTIFNFFSAGWHACICESFDGK
jgi:WD40 repeat protein